jgi:hypothetical protein
VAAGILAIVVSAGLYVLADPCHTARLLDAVGWHVMPGCFSPTDDLHRKLDRQLKPSPIEGIVK